MMLRLPISLAAAMLFSMVILLLLKSTIEIGQLNVSNDGNLRVIDFVRLKKEAKTTRKERVKPKKPAHKKPPDKPKVNIPKPKQPKVNAQPVQALNLNLPLNLAAFSVLGDALVSGNTGRAISTNVIPLVRIDPIYPKRAQMMKMEGYVKMEFTITEFGTVKDIEVIESEPVKLFDNAAIRALTKWKFRPKVEDNKALEQRTVVKINFRLDREQ